MTLFNIFNKADFSKDDERVIRQILEAPETEQIVARAEQAAIENREVLRQRLDTLDARYDKEIANASAPLQAAVRAREAAEATLMAAREKEKQARAAVDAAVAAKGAEACELRQALTASRDLRLDEFYQHLDDAKDKLRHLTRITAFPLGSWTGTKSIRYETNADEVSVLSAALREAMREVEGMALLPLSRAEVSERLTALTHKLEPMLDGFSLPTPRLNENGAVTLNRERLKLVDILQENRVAEAGDMPAPQPRTVQALPRTQKLVAGLPKPTAITERHGSKSTHKQTVRFMGWRI